MPYQLHQSMRQPPTPQPLQATTGYAENVACIHTIPLAELLNSNAHAALAALIEDGHACYAYRSLGDDTHNMWIRQEHPWQERYKTCMQSIARYGICVIDQVIKGGDAQ